MKGLYPKLRNLPFAAMVSLILGAAVWEARPAEFIGPAVAHDFLDRWYYRDTNQVDRIRFCGGLFIGLGAKGLLLTSPDGITWTRQITGTTAQLNGAACGRVMSLPPNPPVLQYVVVGAAGTILTSTDGTNWIQQAVTTQDLNDVTFNLDKFIAATTAVDASQPNLLSSPDGISWSGIKFSNNPDHGLPYYTHSLAVAGYNFIAAGTSQIVDDLWRGTFGTVWQDIGNSGQAIEGIATGNSLTITVGFEGWPLVSTNLGTNWSASVSSVIDPLVRPNPSVGQDIAFGNGTFVVPHSGIPPDGSSLLTTDGTTWSRRDFFAGAVLVTAAYGNGTFVVCNSGGALAAGIYQSSAVANPFISASLKTNPPAMILDISGEVGRVYRVQSSTELTNWTDSLTYTNGTHSLQWTDSIPPGVGTRFYRVINP